MSTWFKVNKNLGNVDRLYIMEIVIGEVTVYKVGKASGHSSKQRMLQIIGSYFDVYRVTPVVRIIKDKEVKNVFDKETRCHHALAEWQYKFDKVFSGHSEIFAVDKEKVLEVYKNVLQDT